MTRFEKKLLWEYLIKQKSASAYILRFVIALIFFYISICFISADIINPFGEYISSYGDDLGVSFRLIAYSLGIWAAIILPMIDE